MVSRGNMGSGDDIHTQAVTEDPAFGRRSTRSVCVVFIMDTIVYPTTRIVRKCHEGI